MRKNNDIRFSFLNRGRFLIQVVFANGKQVVYSRSFLPNSRSIVNYICISNVQIFVFSRFQMLNCYNVKVLKISITLTVANIRT